MIIQETGDPVEITVFNRGLALMTSESVKDTACSENLMKRGKMDGRL
ncbi:hypothetical protein EDC27_2152 [Desulfosoma caldarium]|uniref:Uncharacterized protein n=1 Tax=Desulfosoma caldarium TaxID=610254 RepID=A0A3N1USR2_9BACT|nr:hypothetical protein EDC27_2152 [Desulfosoma caldarium]